MKITLILLIFAISTAYKADDKATLRIAVASNFITTARHLLDKYQETTEQDIILSSGSSGKLTTQIRFGAPFDLFLSADRQHPESLIADGLAYPESHVAYAIGQLALITRLELKTPIALKQVDRPLQIALANPSIAPYGAAANNWLESQQIDLLRHQKITGENINQTWHYFINGGADVAFVALSQILSQEQLGFKYMLLSVPPKQLLQTAVVLSRSKQQAKAQAFLTFLGSTEAKKLIAEAGYKIPESL